MNDTVIIETDKALVVLPEKEEAVIALFSGEYEITIAPILKHIERAVHAFKASNPDAKTEVGRKAIAKFDYKLARSRTALDDAGKNVVSVLKELPKKIDANRKRARDLIDGWKAEITAPVIAWEEAETARKNRHLDAIGTMAELGQMSEIRPAEELRAALDKVQVTLIDTSCDEFQDEYRVAQRSALAQLGRALEARVKYDADQEELARHRAAEAERTAREAKEQAARYARETEERLAAEARERFVQERRATIAVIHSLANVEHMSIEGIKKRIHDIGAREMVPDQWGDFYDEAQKAVAAVIANLQESLAERERIEAERAAEKFALDRSIELQNMRAGADVTYMRASGISRKIEWWEALELSKEKWGSFHGEAEGVRHAVLASLGKSLSETQEHEAKEATERQRERAEREAAEAEIATQATERLRLEEEAKKRRDADEQAAEATRVATAKKKAEEEAERTRAHDVEHRRKIKAAARDALALLLPGKGAQGNTELATEIITMIAKGLIPHVKIEF